MRSVLQDIYKTFCSQRVFIVGGGASLSGFDFSLLEDKPTIAINAAFQDLPNATCIYWTDSSWCANNLDSKPIQNKIGLNDHRCEYRFTGWNNSKTAIMNNTKTTGDAHILNKTGDFGFDPDVDNVRGNNSGTQALNFAVNMGAKEIILLGIDLKYINKKSHYHTRHSLPVKESVYSELFIPSFESMAVEINKMKRVTVLNASETSALKCFKKIKIQDIL